MKQEPTLEQLEKLLSAYRQMGGSDAEISLISREVIYDYLPDKAKPLNEIFSDNDHQSIAKIKEFKSHPKNPFKHAVSDVWHSRWFRYPMIFAGVFLAIFIILNFPLIKARIFPTQPARYETVREVVRPSSTPSAPLDSGEVVPSEDTLVVPKIGVKAPIVFSSSTNEQNIQSDLQKGVAHYYNTAMPGEAGNAFITGHSSNYWWEKGKYNYVFANLDHLKVGDQAKIYYNGNKLLYQVTNVKVVQPTDTSVLAQTTDPTLTLMTCTPPGTNWRRLIVSFNQVSPQYVAPAIVEKQQPVSSTLPNTDSNGFFNWLASLLGF